MLSRVSGTERWTSREDGRLGEGEGDDGVAGEGSGTEGGGRGAKEGGNETADTALHPESCRSEG